MGWNEKMKSFVETVKNIYCNDRRVFAWMVALFLVGVALVLVTMANLAPESADGLIVRYGDSGGYEKGSWTHTLGFGLFGVILAVLHPMFAVRLYERRGGSIAVMFMVVSIAIVLVAMQVLFRVLGER